MSSEPIHFTVIDDQDIYPLQTFKGEYRSLMMLINDHIYQENFGECLGMGRCGTCAVIIESSPTPLTNFNRNEQTTLEKEGIFDQNVHLACQIVIDEQLAGSVIRIYTQY